MNVCTLQFHTEVWVGFISSRYFKCYSTLSFPSQYLCLHSGDEMSLLFLLLLINIANNLLKINNKSIIRDIKDFLPLAYNTNIVMGKSVGPDQLDRYTNRDVCPWKGHPSM